MRFSNHFALENRTCIDWCLDDKFWICELYVKLIEKLVLTTHATDKIDLGMLSVVNTLKAKEKNKLFLLNLFCTGYANETGEAFRPLIHRNWVYASYGVTFIYCLADTADKALKASRKTQDRNEIAFAAADTLVWQTLASIAIPGE